jgi:hypothetical protein
VELTYGLKWAVTDASRVAAVVGRALVEVKLVVADASRVAAVVGGVLVEVNCDALSTGARAQQGTGASR